ncbi:PLDc N-terminal domain-containing protein [Georgenia sp. SYP-B2076]|uniref:PLDc N-terminal domain-containing protein n=1 Tax=Georgenia sp. SYP-B2076 TaxID=2495881 RepID=UPI000F8E766B|nr:PLDc N-terminal domain-containing protein [Georgenia sp. SYP-B2076]
MARKKSWKDLSSGQRAAALALGSAEVALAAAAWTDLARRPAESVNGGKLKWALIIALNIVGPLSYFKWGRRPA